MNRSTSELSGCNCSGSRVRVEPAKMAPTSSGYRPASLRTHVSAASLASRVVIIDTLFRTVPLYRAHFEPVELLTTVASQP
ncbi:MAG: hypothetical protein KJ072_20285 [Verrucomicrobia bacterium]|nr:hypothetical protein [Verrucomicrobiota bacterium]